MAIEIVPDWMVTLEDEDVAFIKKFILASGSLKEIAQQYEVTYPTVRLRMDKVIQKIQMSEKASNDPYLDLIKRLALKEKLDFDKSTIYRIINLLMEKNIIEKNISIKLAALMQVLLISAMEIGLSLFVGLQRGIFYVN